MGCFGSRVAYFRSCSFPSSRRNSQTRNAFAVQNVDDTGHGVSPGKLEVTETDLVLHVKGKPSLTWPLRCLRRYGYDNDLFSFESGRRCPTGAGIFAFRCHRAQSLFNLLQAKIQGNPSALPTLPSTPITPPTVGTPVNGGNNNPATPVSSTFVYVNLSESNSSRFISSSAVASTGGAAIGSAPPFPSSSDPPDVVQTQSSSVPPEPTIAPGRGPPPLLSRAPSSEQNHPVYMNVESHGGALYSASSSSSAAPNYQNDLSSIPRGRRPTALNFGGGETPSSTTSTTAPSTKSSTAGPSYSYAPSTAARPSSIAVARSKLPPPPPAHQPQSQDALYSNVFCSKGKSTSQRVPPPLPIQEPAEINYAELDLKTDRPSSSSNSPYMGRLGLLKHHHQLLSSSQSAPQGAADPLTASRLTLASCSGSGAQGSSSSRTDFHPKLTNNQNNGDLGYATIDFDKTAELTVITRSKINLGFNNDNDSKSVSKKSKHGSTAL